MKTNRFFIILLAFVILIGVLTFSPIVKLIEEHLIERVYIDVDLNADAMIISDEQNYNVQKSFLITDKKEIKKFLASYKWHDWHLPCCWNGSEPNYTVKFVYGDFVEEIIYFRNDWIGSPYNNKLAVKLEKYIYDFKEREDASYQYTMTAPLSVDYESLKAKLQGTENLYVFSNSSTPKFSYFTLGYTDYQNNYRHIDNFFRLAMDEHELGKFEPDNVFIPIVNELKNEGLYMTNSKPRFSGSQGDYIIRKMDVYLSRIVDDETIEKYKSMWKDAEKYECFLSDWGLEYVVPQTYKFTIMSDHQLGDQEIEYLDIKYGISLLLSQAEN